MDYYMNMTDEELASAIRTASEWDADMSRALCRKADIEEEWDACEPEDAEKIIEKAAEILGAEIY